MGNPGNHQAPGNFIQRHPVPMLRLVKRDEGFSGLAFPSQGGASAKSSGEKAKILEEFIVNNLSARAGLTAFAGTKMPVEKHRD